MEAMLRKYVNEGYKGKLRVRLCAMPVDAAGGAGVGTADALRSVKDKIKVSHVFVSVCFACLR
jgi:hypothetical protein